MTVGESTKSDVELPGSDSPTPESRAIDSTLKSLDGLDEVLMRAVKANESRAMPWFVVFLGAVVSVFWAVMGMVPDGRSWPTPSEVTTGVIVGGLLIALGAVLALLSDVLPARQIAKAVEDAKETERRLAMERNRLMRDARKGE